MRYVHVTIGDSFAEEIDRWIEDSAQPSKMLAYVNLLKTGLGAMKSDDIPNLGELIGDLESKLDDNASYRDLESLASQQDLWALENRLMQRLDRIEKSLGPKAI